MSWRAIVTIGFAGEGLNEALASDADGVLIPIATNARPAVALRNTAREALQAIHETGKQGLVLVNHPRTQLLRDDLDALVSPDLSAILLNHATEPQDIRDGAVLLREFELTREMDPGAVAIVPVINSARGLLRTADMVQASPRVRAVLLESDRYARDVGARTEESGPRLAYARGAVVAAARAFDVLPLVSAGPLELLELAQYGFAGVVLPDARGVTHAQVAFRPTDEARERARRAIDRYDSVRAENGWVARDGFEVVDAAAVRKARQLLD